MKKMIFVLLAFLTSCQGGIEDGPHPNIILILADDLGWNQLGCYGGPYQTPYIDDLARQGMRFTDAYASAPVCSPTRAALMTGKYPARLHLTDFIKGSLCPDSLLRQPDWQKYLPLDEITLGEIFREYGYRTAIFGKWHLSREKNPPESEAYNPDKQGFDEYMVTYKPRRRVTDPEHDPHNVDSITDRAIRFLDENQQDPFFLMVSHNAIHDPIMESRENMVTFQASDPDTSYAVDPTLGAMVSRLDNGTGRLLAKLEALDLKENTVVFFCSDNGGKETYASQFPFRRGKGWLYEGGIRVPMIARWPDRIQAGSQNATITSTIDLFPTLLELAGLPPAYHPLDGRSIAGELLGTGRLEDGNQYWHYPHYHLGSGMKPASAIRKGNFKLIEWHADFLMGGTACELYDLESDPGESRDLSSDHPEIMEELRMDLHKWRGDVDAQMPALNHE
jgi:arylsulfatase A-like enzyme